MPGYVFESVIAEHYGWTLDYIRSLDLADFYAHLHICVTKDGLDQEFQVMLVGGGESSQDVSESSSVVPNKMDHSGSFSNPKKEKVMKFDSKVRKVRIDSNGNPIE